MSVHPSELSTRELLELDFTSAQCLFDPELHTGPEATIETAEQTAARVEVAREVCLSCPVLAQCFVRALNGRPDRGVWAGLMAETYADVRRELADADLGEVA